MEQQIRDIIKTIEIKITPFGVETNGENVVQQLVKLFSQSNFDSSKEICKQLLEKEREWLKNDKTPLCYGEGLDQEKHLDNSIALQRVITLIETQQ